MPATSSSPDHARPYDAIVVGGGFYGARLALHLRRRGLRVLLVEREARLLERASLRNQARVHNGYHYPRSVLTSLRSRFNYARFLQDYAECADRSFAHYYASGRGLTKITAALSAVFCRGIDARVRPAPDHVRALFDGARIDAVFQVEECAFDAARLRERVLRDLDAQRVDVALETEATSVTPSPSGARVVLRDRRADWSAEASIGLNCTYSGLNRLLAASNAATIPAKHELTELALVEPPEALGGAAVTVMDGPFFSLMPYPSRGLFTLSHVRYTPHCNWADEPGAPIRDAATVLAERQRRPMSRFEHMVRDAARYLPAMRASRYVDSLWEIKTLMPRSEQDDSRPILLRRCLEHPSLLTVLGAKIDSVYDVEDALTALLDQRPAPHAPRPTPTDVRRIPAVDRRPAGRR
jgi:glycine/D-amino acid oxidase-like deaminating enzyme